MAKDYEIDREGLQQVATSPKMQAAMTNLAHAGMAGAQAISPYVSGEYHDSFRVEEVTTKGGWDQMPRAGARIVNDSAHAMVVERRHHVLATIKAIIESGGF